MSISALVVKDPWASKIVAGEKTIELRTRKTRKVGEKIYIAKAGTKTLIGCATIEKCVLMTIPLFEETINQHCTSRCYYDKIHAKNKKLYGWFLQDILKFDTLIPYDHPQGAQMWVKINSIL